MMASHAADNMGRLGSDSRSLGCEVGNLPSDFCGV